MTVQILLLAFACFSLARSVIRLTRSINECDAAVKEIDEFLLT